MDRSEFAARLNKYVYDRIVMWGRVDRDNAQTPFLFRCECGCNQPVWRTIEEYDAAGGARRATHGFGRGERLGVSAPGKRPALTDGLQESRLRLGERREAAFDAVTDAVGSLLAESVDAAEILERVDTTVEASRHRFFRHGR